MVGGIVKKYRRRSRFIGARRLVLSKSGGLALGIRLGIGIHDVERYAVARSLDDAHVIAPELARVAAAAGMRDHVDLLVHAERVIRDALEFFLDHQAALQPRVVRRDPRGAGVLVAA